MFIVSVYDSVLFTVLVRISNLCCFGRALYTVYCSSLLFVIVVIVNVTAYADESSKQQESSIIAAWKGLELGLGFSLPVLGVTLLAVGLKNSLAVLFICESQTGLKNLGNLYVSLVSCDLSWKNFLPAGWKLMILKRQCISRNLSGSCLTTADVLCTSTQFYSVSYIMIIFLDSICLCSTHTRTSAVAERPRNASCHFAE